MHPVHWFRKALAGIFNSPIPELAVTQVDYTSHVYKCTRLCRTIQGPHKKAREKKRKKHARFMADDEEARREAGHAISPTSSS